MQYQPGDPALSLSARYGKSQVRVARIVRDGAWHTFHDLTVDVALVGDFDACYRLGDNRVMPATDTMRNLVYLTADDHDLQDLDAYAADLAGRLLAAGPTVSSAEVRLRAHPWQRLAVDGLAHPHSFTRGNGDRLVSVIRSADGSRRCGGGLSDLMVLKTTASAWVDFQRDAATTLPDDVDRILATYINAEWQFAADAQPSAAHYDQIVAALLRAFSDHESPSVQYTLFRMAQSVLHDVAAVSEITLRLPNKHHIGFNLAPFGRANTKSVFHVTNEPFGLIEGTVRR